MPKQGINLFAYIFVDINSRNRNPMNNVSIYKN